MKTELDVADVKSSLRSVMWRNVEIERTEDRLTETREIIAFWSRYVMDKTFHPNAGGEASATAGWELQNMLTVCALITSAAYTRSAIAASACACSGDSGGVDAQPNANVIVAIAAVAQMSALTRGLNAFTRTGSDRRLNLRGVVYGLKKTPINASQIAILEREFIAP